MIPAKDDPITRIAIAIERIAVAMERIADALSGTTTTAVPPEFPGDSII